MEIMTIQERAEAIKIAQALAVAKADLGRLGLFKTMHALDAAVKAIGYEIADRLDIDLRAEAALKDS